jgi:four helix bundle protein
MPQDFKDIIVWKESFDFGIDIHNNVLNKIPEWEKFGLRSQLSRAVVSISCNLAEGSGKKTAKDFASYIYNALGSAKETENLLMFINKVGYISDDKFKELNSKLDIIGKKLMNFLKSVEAKID